MTNNNKEFYCECGEKVTSGEHLCKGWEEKFDKIWDEKVEECMNERGYRGYHELKEFVVQLLQKEREKTYDNGYADGTKEVTEAHDEQIRRTERQRLCEELEGMENPYIKNTPQWFAFNDTVARAIQKINDANN